MLRILHVSSHKTWRGGEQQATYLLEELRKHGVFQWVFCAENNAMCLYAKKRGLSYYTFNKGFLINFFTQNKLKKVCQKHHIDLIHVHDSHAHTLAFISALFGNTTPIIVSRRVDFPVQKSYFSKWKYNHKKIARFICVSNKIREVLEKDIENKSKLSVVHSGIDLKRFEGKKNKAVLHKELELPENTKIVANVASLASHKDYYTFVNTAELVLQKMKNLVFLIIGDGELKKDIQEYIRQKNLSDKILMIGFRKDIPDILPEFDVFLFPSETEGLGTSVLDALAVGVPVVSTRAGGIEEMIKHEENGLLADVKDHHTLAEHVLYILNNRDLAEKLSKKGLDTVHEYTKENMALKTLHIYQEIIKEEKDLQKKLEKKEEILIPEF
jgi:L-malate glycosyltransferase